MFELAKPSIKIADLSHRVVLCTMLDVIDENGTMHLRRKPVAWLWARIDTALNLPSFQSPYGYSVHESRNAWGTHRVMVRYQSFLEPTSAAWVYEERRKTSPRWYKVLGYEESDMWLLMTTHLVERSPEVQPPVSFLEAVPNNNVDL
jgi:hypothetical protein